MRLVVYRVWSINPVGQSFDVEFALHLFWYEPEVKPTWVGLDGIAMFEPDDVHLPTIIYENALAIETVEGGEAAIQGNSKNPPGVIHWESRLRGTFFQELELTQFPFDVQALTMTMRIKTDNQRRYFGVLKKESYFLIKPEAEQMTDWNMYKPAIHMTTTKAGKPICHAHLAIRRKHDFYTINVIFMMSAICSLCFTTAAYPADIEGLADRSAVTLTLLLTAVAFKFSISDALPKIPYSTKLDVHLNVCIGSLMVIGIVNCFVATLSAPEKQARTDYYFYVSFAGLWCFYHIIGAVTVMAYVARCCKLLGAPLDAGRRRASKPWVIFEAQSLTMHGFYVCSWCPKRIPQPLTEFSMAVFEAVDNSRQSALNTVQEGIAVVKQAVEEVSQGGIPNAEGAPRPSNIHQGRDERSSSSERSASRQNPDWRRGTLNVWRPVRPL